MDDLQEDLYEWQMHNYPNSTVWTDIAGIAEEFGELARVVIADDLGEDIEKFDTVDDAEMDAIGDLAIYVMQLASKRGYSFEECVRHAADEVMDDDSRHG